MLVCNIVIAFHSTVILGATKNLLFRGCFRDPLTMPPFRDPHGMSIAHATCDHSLSALSNPLDFVASLCRDDNIRSFEIFIAEAFQGFPYRKYCYCTFQYNPYKEHRLSQSPDRSL